MVGNTHSVSHPKTHTETDSLTEAGSSVRDVQSHALPEAVSAPDIQQGLKFEYD